MRILYLMRGLPASGKSYWIKEKGLEAYAISPDTLRLQMAGYTFGLDGHKGISQEFNKQVFENVKQLLINRFSEGAFTILDATNLNTSYLNNYAKLANSYRYKVYVVDFTKIPIDVILDRNDARFGTGRYVPSVVYDNMLKHLNDPVPHEITVLSPDAAWELITSSQESMNLDKYKAVVHIGDIHGCATALKAGLPTIEPDKFYIFLGDLIDRGIENARVIDYIYDICKSPNVVLLEGNHDTYLWNYFIGRSTPKQFSLYTSKELASDEYKNKCGFIAGMLKDCFYYSFKGKYVFCSHGGVPINPCNRLPNPYPICINSSEYIHGTGAYGDMLEVNKAFEENMLSKDRPNSYQIHGHRNVDNLAMKINEHCYNLCDRIEFGGKLRILTLDKEGFHESYIQNTVFKHTRFDEPSASDADPEVVKNWVGLNSNPNAIKVVPQNVPNVKSYNFTRDVFFSANWDNLSIKARGLYINEATKKVVARGYNKFFNINEVPETNIPSGNLFRNIKYPLRAYKKENGFLGVLGYDEANDRLLYCSKTYESSQPDDRGDYARLFKEVLLKSIPEDKIKEKYLEVCKMVNGPCSLAFEVIEPNLDPHIIKYQVPKVVLLDVISNTLTFKKTSYSTVCVIADFLGLEAKKLVYTFNSDKEFRKALAEMSKYEYKLNNRFIEGYVFEDSHFTPFMFKFKTSYYTFWKMVRGSLSAICTGSVKPQKLQILSESPEFVRFEEWLGSQPIGSIENLPIITIRDRFYNDTGRG